MGFPNKRKLSILLFFECLETLMKHQAQVFEIASQSSIINQEQQQKNYFWQILAFVVKYFSSVTGL